MASIVRVVAFNQVNLADVTWTLVGVATWTTIEQSVGIICACLPTLRPLFGRLLSNIKQHKSSGKGATSDDPEAASDHLPLSDYRSSQKTGGGRMSLETRKQGFERLDEGPVHTDINVVTAHATKTSNDQLPSAPRGIFMQRSLEQHFDKADSV